MLADRVLTELGRSGGRVVLVIDDLHELRSPQSLTQLARVLAGLPSASLADELTPGELRVLPYLPSSLSRQQIATELGLSLATVSTHISSVYAKLGANRRTDAVDRARTLRIRTVL